MTSLHVICGLGPPQSKILATPMPEPVVQIMNISQALHAVTSYSTMHVTVQFDKKTTLLPSNVSLHIGIGGQVNAKR